MEDWIDIIKERLQDAQAPLPPNDWEEFEATSLPAKRTRVLPWLLPALAVAAGLAAFLFLRKLAAPEGGIQVIPQPPAPVAVVADPIDSVEEIPSSPIVNQPVTSRARQADVKPQAVIEVEETTPVEELVTTTLEEETAAPDSQESVTFEPVIPSYSPFVPEPQVAKPVFMKVGPALGVVAGSGLLAALVVPALGKLQTGSTVEISSPAPGEMNSGLAYFNYGSGNSVFNGGYNYLNSNYIYHSSLAENDGSHMVPDSPFDQLIKSPTHFFPVKVGLSAWIPVADRLYLSTGLDYSWYRSTFTYSLSGEQQQHVHYLGIPVRMDWVFASGKRLDAYVGGGLEADFCLAASLGGKGISKDRIKLSLLGAGGVQVHLTRRLGVYVEPQVLWLVPTDAEGDMLATYRSAHPLMFSVATGFRIKLGRGF